MNISKILPFWPVELQHDSNVFNFIYRKKCYFVHANRQLVAVIVIQWGWLIVLSYEDKVGKNYRFFKMFTSGSDYSNVVSPIYFEIHKNSK